MQILALDTSSKFLSIAILRNNKIVSQINVDAYRRLSSLLIPSLKRILKKSNISLKDINCFAVGLGPGSFTGLRIGITTIKSMAMALNKPVVGISSLDVIAYGTGTKEGVICPIIDARRDNVYACIYRRENAHLKKLTKYLLINIKELANMINNKTMILGDGLIPFGQMFRRHKEKEIIFLDEKLWYPKAANLAFLALDKYKKRQLTGTNRLTPLYLYPKECQIRQKEK